MATSHKIFRVARGTASALANYTGPEGELVYNTTTKQLHLQDGSTAGGAVVGTGSGGGTVTTVPISGDRIEATFDGVPVGTVLPFAGGESNTVPRGFLLCDGRAVYRADYDELFAAIGTTYGVGDGSKTFNLPSLTDDNLRYIIKCETPPYGVQYELETPIPLGNYIWLELSASRPLYLWIGRFTSPSTLNSVATVYYNQYFYDNNCVIVGLEGYMGTSITTGVHGTLFPINFGRGGVNSGAHWNTSDPSSSSRGVRMAVSNNVLKSLPGYIYITFYYR